MIENRITTQEIEPITFQPEQYAIQKDGGLFSAPKTWSHAFSQFDPNIQTHKANEMRPHPDSVDPEVDRLDGILRHGIISSDFAQRTGLKISRNWNDFYNNHFVSLAPDYDDAIAHARFATNDETIFAVIVRKSAKVKVDIMDHIEDLCRCVKRRIPPREFIGLVVDSPIESSLEDAVSVMLDIYKDRPQLALPVYNGEGKMFWPYNTTGFAQGEFYV